MQNLHDTGANVDANKVSKRCQKGAGTKMHKCFVGKHT